MQTSPLACSHWWDERRNPGSNRPSREQGGELLQPIEPLGSGGTTGELHREPVDPEFGECRVIISGGERREADRQRGGAADFLRVVARRAQANRELVDVRDRRRLDRGRGRGRIRER